MFSFWFVGILPLVTNMTSAMGMMSGQVGEDGQTSAVMGGSSNASCQGDIIISMQLHV